MKKFIKKTNVLAAVLCACLFLAPGFTARAEEIGSDPEAEPLTTAPALTVTPVELTLTNGQFTVTQSFSCAEQEEVQKAVDQINAQLLQIPCSGTSFAYAGVNLENGKQEVYHRYETDVIYQISEEAVPYLTRYIRDAQLAEEAEAAFQILQATPGIDADTLIGGHVR